MRFLGKNIAIIATSHFLDESQVKHVEIDIEYDFINMKAGMIIPEKRIQEILTRLGFEL